MTTAIETKERPILFSGPMVRAIIDGRKTQTRRIIKPQPPEGYRSMVRECDPKGGWWFCNMPFREGPFSVGEFAKWDSVYPKCPYGTEGGRLWVREAFYDRADYAEIGKLHRNRFVYVADGVKSGWKSRPSIHMPRIASRITLEITNIRAEKLRDITEEDAIDEGAQCAGFPAALTNYGAFGGLWKQINGEGSWKENPWVWVIKFKKL